MDKASDFGSEDDEGSSPDFLVAISYGSTKLVRTLDLERCRQFWSFLVFPWIRDQVECDAICH